MALSEEEQRVLDELERALSHDDPALAATLRADVRLHPLATLRPPRLAAQADPPSDDAAPEPGAVIALDRRAALGGLALVLLGLALLVGGLAVHPSVSVLGFVGMLVGALRLLGAVRHDDAQPRRQPAQSERGHQDARNRTH